VHSTGAFSFSDGCMLAYKAGLKVTLR